MEAKFVVAVTSFAPSVNCDAKFLCVCSETGSYMFSVVSLDVKKARHC